MRQDAPHREDRPRKRTRYRRWIQYAAIAIYLAGLALIPEWATLGFSAPALAEEPKLEGKEAERFQAVSWDVLAGFPYDFEMPGALEDASPEALAERNERLIPTQVRALDRRSVAVRGYLIPIEITHEGITEFILAAKNEIGCCFGDGLSMNQWIHVKAPKGRAYDSERIGITATVLGVLEVGEEVHQGTVMSLYRMHKATVRAK